MKSKFGLQYLFEIPLLSSTMLHFQCLLLGKTAITQIITVLEIVKDIGNVIMKIFMDDEYGNFIRLTVQ